MKVTAITILAVMFVSQALAGPFRSVAIAGSGLDPDFTLEVPAGKAVSITNFHESGADPQYASMTAIINNNPSVNVLRAAPLDGKNFQKDVIITGPATVKVSVPAGNSVFLTYRVFAN